MLLVALALALAPGGSPADSAAFGGLSLVFAVLAIGPGPHPVRTRILEHLRVLPGDHLRSIARTLSVSLGDARYHLHVLLRNGLVREQKVRHRARYYATDRQTQAERNDLFRRHWEQRDTRVRVLNAVRVHGGAHASQVARAMGISRQLAAYHLDRLASAGYVARREGLYWPAFEDSASRHRPGP